MHVYRLWMALVIGLLRCGIGACNSRALNDDETQRNLLVSAMERRSYREAIGMMMPQASAGNTEFQFSVGYAELIWLSDPNPMEAPIYSEAEAIKWIRKAANKNFPQAAGFLREGYQWGRYGMPKNERLYICWRNVELGISDSKTCSQLEGDFLKR